MNQLNTEMTNLTEGLNTVRELIWEEKSKSVVSLETIRALKSAELDITKGVKHAVMYGS